MADLDGAAPGQGWDGAFEAEFDLGEGWAVEAERSGYEPGTAPAEPEDVRFTAVHPPSVVPGRWYTLLFLIHLAGLDEQVRATVRSWAPRLGGQPETSSRPAPGRLLRGTTLTVEPKVPGVVFNPARVEVEWHEDIQEQTFRMSVTSASEQPVIAGFIEVSLGPLLLAYLPIGLQVVPDDPLGEPTTTSTPPARLVERVFASYSRRDADVVDACTAMYRALGIQVVLDRADLHSGVDWRETLHQLIDDCDAFQLYWSNASSASSEVEVEWRHALSRSTGRQRFIRPLYWESPMPATPAALSHLHFSRIDLAEIDRLRRSLAPS